MSNESERDRFEVWLIDMDDALARFFGMISPMIVERLDYAPQSLTVIEGILLDRYASIHSVRPASESRFADGAARYVGEVFRKGLGGKWSIELEDKKNVFYGRPQLIGMRGQRIQISPLSLVTACLDRRTGKYIKTVFDNMYDRSL